jgi:metal-responsive CopG/Arc/MetJ family transcriptional regulator
MLKVSKDRSIIVSTKSSINDTTMKISVSLPAELIQYIDDQVDNRSKLIESLLVNWQKKQQQDKMVAACLLLDEIQTTEETEWQQAALTDWEASGW